MLFPGLKRTRNLEGATVSGSYGNTGTPSLRRKVGMQDFEAF